MSKSAAVDCLLLIMLVAAAALAQAGHGPPSASPATLFAQGTQLLQAGDLAGAAADFEAVARLDPSSAAARTNLGVIAMREKHWPQALEQLREAQRLDPSLVGVRLDIGLVYYRMNDYASAAPEFAYVLAHNPGANQARYLLGLSSFFAEHYPDALAALQPLWREESKSLTYLYVLGSAAEKAGDQQVAQQAFAQMAEVGQGTPEFHLYAGKAALGKQQYADAERELTEALAGNPRLPMANFYLGRTYSQERRFEQAREALLAEIRLEPDVAYSYDELGRLEAMLGNTAQATAAFESALARDPSIASAYVGLAQIAREHQQYQRSLSLLEKALEQQPNSASVHYLRGQILARLHQQAAAKVEFTQAQELLHRLNEELKKPGDSSAAADAQTSREAALE